MKTLVILTRLFLQYLDKYLKFPPPGQQPSSFPDKLTDCYIHSRWTVAQQRVNPCWVSSYPIIRQRLLIPYSLPQNPYHITEGCPSLSNLNGHLWNIYLNRDDVRAAIHAPAGKEWTECVWNVGLGEKPSSIQAALPRVIEATNRVLIAHGDWDGALL